MTRQARFEICRGDSGWWARFRAANGRVVWVTETYTRRIAAARAIASIAETVWSVDHGLLHAYIGGERVEVRQVDERP